METYLRTLKSLGYTGPLTIEREIAHDRERQKRDIGQAVQLLEKLRAKIL
jgi:sugar phosphate isomerase/epimerase